MAIFTELARAKINLTLRVLGKRADGYHDLQSVVVFADTGDVLTLDTGQPAGITAGGQFGTAIDGANIIEAALARLEAAEPRLTLGHVTLDKRLPVAAGIGGGSADAAAVLRAVRTANPAHAARIDWHRIAATLGADVPVCLESRAAWMTGTGEQITPLAAPLPAIAAVLVNPCAPVPRDKTAQVFRSLQAPAAPATPAGIAAPDLGHTFQSLTSYIRNQGNGLLGAAITVVPDIRRVLDALQSLEECRLSQLSGAGPTCFGLFDSEDAATAAEGSLIARHPGWWITSSRLS